MNAQEKAAPAGTGTASRTAFSGHIVAEIPKNSREVYRIIRRDFKGYHLVDVRVWYDDRMTGELRPGKAGISFKVEDLPELVAVLESLIDWGEAR